jgi:hypothetical protein
MDECKCDRPGYCERWSRHVSQSGHRICQKGDLKSLAAYFGEEALSRHVVAIPPRDRDPARQLVVAACYEHIDWLSDVPYEAIVYKKCGVCPTGVPCEKLVNTQREAGTYLYHIITRYDDLAPITIFCQGNPFDHSPDFLERVHIHCHRPVSLTVHYSANAPAVWSRSDQVEQVGKFSVRYGNALADRTADRAKPTWFNPAAWDYVFDCPMPDPLWFGYGACWAVPRDFIRARPREFYAHLFRVCHSGMPLQNYTDPPINGYTLEAMWRYIWEGPYAYPHRQIWENPPLPSWPHMIAEASRAAVAATVSGFERATDAAQARRWAACHTCDLYRHQDQRCGGVEGCGCWLKAKIPLAAMQCPKARWPE